MTRAQAERAASRYLEEWTRRNGGAVLELTVAREGRTHWAFGTAAVSGDLHHGGPQALVVDKASGETAPLAFWTTQAALGIMTLDEVRRFLDPAQIRFLEAFLPPTEERQ